MELLRVGLNNGASSETIHHTNSGELKGGELCPRYVRNAIAKQTTLQIFASNAVSNLSGNHLTRPDNQSTQCGLLQCKRR
jgi:hypothetical protein